MHGILDYTTVLLLILSPHLFGMQFAATVFTYSLAFIHLVLTLLTDFEMGLLRIIPLHIHGAIEVLLSIVLVIVANVFRIWNDVISFYYYLIFAGVLFIVWLFSTYNPASAARQRNFLH
jgi:hypothetical protein